MLIPITTLGMELSLGLHSIRTFNQPSLLMFLK